MKTIINIHSGEWLNPAVVRKEDYIHVVGGKVTRIYFEDQLTKNGQPDARKVGEVIGIRFEKSGVKNGNIAFTDGETEMKAALLRREISNHYQLIEEAKKKLVDLYAAIPENQIQYK